MELVQQKITGQNAKDLKEKTNPNNVYVKKDIMKILVQIQIVLNVPSNAHHAAIIPPALHVLIV